MASVELPFAQGLLFERQCAELLQSSGQARALQYAFFAERQATKVSTFIKIFHSWGEV